MNFSLGCNELKSSVMSCMFVRSGSWISGMSPTYWKYPVILCFSVRCAKWVFSRCCRKNSAIRPEIGAPIASPSFWIMIFMLLVK